MNKLDHVTFNSSLLDTCSRLLYRDLFEESLLENYVTLHIFVSFDEAFIKFLDRIIFQGVLGRITFNERTFHLTELKHQSVRPGQEIPG